MKKGYSEIVLCNNLFKFILDIVSIILVNSDVFSRGCI